MVAFGKRCGWLAAVAFVFSVAAEAQLPPCSDLTTFFGEYDYTLRTNTNNLQSYASSYVIGNYWYYWTPSLTATAYKDSVQTHTGSASNNPGYTAYIYWNDALSTTGPGYYTLYVTHVFSAWCGTTQHTSAVGNAVQKPTITQSNAGELLPQALWNLGPGTADAIPTSNGYTYRQRITLTINNHCSYGYDTCNDTPIWTINSPASTLALSSTTGTSVDLTKGAAMGNCSYDTTVSVKAGALPGFSSDNITFGVNSPGSVAHQPDIDFTTSFGSGYLTYWALKVGDVCSMTNYLTTLPMNETFGTFQQQNGATNWLPGPSPVNWPAFNYSNDVFLDAIGTNCTSCSPAATFTSNRPPFMYNNILLSGAHAFHAGSTVSGNGMPVYSGTIQYFQDHGANNP